MVLARVKHWCTYFDMTTILKYRYFFIDSAAAAKRLLTLGAADPETNRATGNITLNGRAVKVWPASKAIERRAKLNPGRRERQSATRFKVDPNKKPPNMF